MLAPAGDERAVLTGIADRLPAQLAGRGRARTWTAPSCAPTPESSSPSRAGRPADGRVRLTVDTGCRPVGAGYTPPSADRRRPEAAALSRR